MRIVQKLRSLHHRDYVASQGRLRSEDPARDDINPYRYVGNDPVNRVDPSGSQDHRLIEELTRSRSNTEHLNWLESLTEKEKKGVVKFVRRLQANPSYREESAAQAARPSAVQDVAICVYHNCVTGARTITYRSGKSVYIPPPRTRFTYYFPTELFVDFGGYIVTGPYNLATGKTGRALGKRSVAITENSGDGTFDGGFNDWVRFSTRGIAGELTCMNAGGEAIGGADLATEELLGSWDRGFRGFEAVVGAAGTVIGGVGFVRKAATRGAAVTKRANPPQYRTPFQPLTDVQKKNLRQNFQNRSITRDEYLRLDWDRRFNNRRQRGVSRFWAAERRRLRAGASGTRNWTPGQHQAIWEGRTPRFGGQPIEGHHRYNALDHPQLADEPMNIFPATWNEHFYRWHDGNFQKDTFGNPLNPRYPEEF